MSDTPGQPAADEVAQYIASARRAARRYAGVLLGYAAITAVLAILIALAPAMLGIGVLIWLAATITVFVYERRQRSLLSPYSNLHLIVVMTCASIWVIAFMGGVFGVADHTIWWLVAGGAAALPALIGAIFVYRAS